jgi:glutathione S-transferase
MIRIYHLDPDSDWLGGARNGAKVMIALRELEVAHEVVWISRRDDMRDPQSAFRRRINPWGTVPVLEQDGFILRESAAILRYLAELSPGNSLWPAAPQRRALADQWLTWECAMLVPSLLNVVRLGRYDGVEASSADLIENAQARYEEKRAEPGMRDAQDRWHANLQLLEANLADREYAADHYSLADIALGCAVPIGTVFGMPLLEYPHINAWLTRLASRASWQAERTFMRDYEGGKKAGLIRCSAAERERLPARRWAKP